VYYNTLFISIPKSTLIFGYLPDGRQAGGVVNTYKNAMQYKENYLQILMSMIIV